MFVARVWPAEGGGRKGGWPSAKLGRIGPEFGPAVGTPLDRRQLQLRRARRVAVVIMVREHLAFRRFQRLLAAGADEAAVRGEPQGAAAVEHILPVLVAVGTFDLGGAADADVV